MAVVPFVVALPAAFAGVGLTVTPFFPGTVTVGQIGLPAAIQVVNGSTAPERGGTLTINRVNLVRACGTTAFVGSGDCPASNADRGVFLLSPTATGESGTACAGQSFNITVISPRTGQVSFLPSPTSGPIVLTPPGTPNSLCRIDFTFNVVKMPANPLVGSSRKSMKTAQIAYAVGAAAVNGTTGASSGSSLVTVGKPPRH